MSTTEQLDTIAATAPAVVLYWSSDSLSVAVWVDGTGAVWVEWCDGPRRDSTCEGTTDDLAGIVAEVLADIADRVGDCGHGVCDTRPATVCRDCGRAWSIPAPPSPSP